MKTPNDTDKSGVTPSMHWRLLVALIALAFAGFGFWAQTSLNQRQLQTLESAQIYPQAKSLSDFTLSDDRGEDFGQERWQGGWNLLFFGYTHCPDVCPNTLHLLQGLKSQWQDSGQSRYFPKVTFISVDPERDQPEQLHSYVTYFDPDFSGATGDPAQLQSLSRQLGAMFWIEEHTDGATTYNVDHSAAIYLLDPQARLVARFSAPQVARQMLPDLGVIMDNY